MSDKSINYRDNSKHDGDLTNVRLKSKNIHISNFNLLKSLKKTNKTVTGRPYIVTHCECLIGKHAH